MFLASAGIFIDTDFHVGPNVDMVGCWVKNSVPFLSQPVVVPFAKGVIKLVFTCGGIAAS